MPNFIIRSTSMKGNFELLNEDSNLLYVATYKNMFSGEATSSFDKSTYMIRSPHFWQSQFDVLKNDRMIGKFSFNWKGEIIINYTNPAGTEMEMRFQYKSLWKVRFVLTDREGKELLAMVSSWLGLKYHYDVSVTDGIFSDTEIKELLMICGYSANLFMSTMMAGM